MTTTSETLSQAKTPNPETANDLARVATSRLSDALEAGNAQRDQVDLNLDVLEAAEQTLYEAGQLVPEEVVTLENLDRIIDNIEKILSTQSDPGLYNETERSLDALIEARNRLELNTESADVDAIFENYADLARRERPVDKAEADALEDKIIAAYNDVAGAVYQMNNDIEMYKSFAAVLKNQPDLLKRG